MGGIKPAGKVVVSRGGAGAGVERGASEVIWRCNKSIATIRAILLLEGGTKHMPTIPRVGRYRFFFYSNEGNEPSHIHVKAGRDQAKFWLEPINLALNYGFRANELNEIERIIQEHHEELLEAWNERPS